MVPCYNNNTSRIYSGRFFCFFLILSLSFAGSWNVAGCRHQAKCFSFFTISCSVKLYGRITNTELPPWPPFESRSAVCRESEKFDRKCIRGPVVRRTSFWLGEGFSWDSLMNCCDVGFHYDVHPELQSVWLQIVVILYELLILRIIGSNI